MAVRDFKQYLIKVQGQYLEMKNDLADFEQAFRDGYITEDQLSTVKDDVAKIEENYQRLIYVSYLLELPQRKSKKPIYEKANKKVKNALVEMQADDNSVFNENKSTLDHLRAELKRLNKENKNKSS